MTDAKHPPKMAPRADAPPGLETDGQGHVIPLKDRLPEDRAEAAAADGAVPEEVEAFEGGAATHIPASERATR